MYGPKCLVYQLFSFGRGKLVIRRYNQTFSYSIVWGSGYLDMYGPKHLVLHLFRGVGHVI